MLQDYLRRLFENNKLTVAGLLKKTDSVELNNGPEFLGVISADDPEGDRASRCKWRFWTSISTMNDRGPQAALFPAVRQ